MAGFRGKVEGQINSNLFSRELFVAHFSAILGVGSFGAMIVIGLGEALLKLTVEETSPWANVWEDGVFLKIQGRGDKMLCSGFM